MIARQVALALSVLWAATACTQAKFSARNEVLSKSVFGDANGVLRQEDSDSADGQIRQDTSDNAEGVLRQGDGSSSGSFPVTPGSGSGSGAVTIKLLCSDRESKDLTSLKEAIANGFPVHLLVGDKVCSSDASAIRNLLISGSITIENLRQLCAPLIPAGQNIKLDIVLNGESQLLNQDGGRNGLEVLYARNTDTSVPAEAADENCDRRASPLVIHLASDPNNPKPVDLSSQEDGVLFDILGERNRHRAIQISWFTNHDYRFLSLPDRRGRVRGIDQLFGDNTKGPDGQFADHGYAALAKYDLNRDSRIDASDPVFHSLRLWLDRDFDGVSRPDELSSLSSAAIEYIDLDFSTDYAERDRYGNETKMKSVVGYVDGSLDLIFDLWFAYRPGG